MYRRLPLLCVELKKATVCVVERRVVFVLFPLASMNCEPTVLLLYPPTRYCSVQLVHKILPFPISFSLSFFSSETHNSQVTTHVAKHQIYVHLFSIIGTKSNIFNFLFYFILKKYWIFVALINLMLSYNIIHSIGIRSLFFFLQNYRIISGHE